MNLRKSRSLTSDYQVRKRNDFLDELSCRFDIAKIRQTENKNKKIVKTKNSRLNNNSQQDKRINNNDNLDSDQSECDVSDSSDATYVPTRKLIKKSIKKDILSDDVCLALDHKDK